ncbi:Phospholipase/carboxylesterase [Gloeophyllum trabeum ATCC 11539]|uniref:Acyl-protein thioesterase 1 n=1 Tax=Gloeophyllum trabeum (strain ATCC 11539 / FP-39264 / Madison 617) TaxID=670483 RepID=S7QIB4_GLOTA|nr:Phospholipase/carboxylesterase [Gloeophyllum trabeum ATCC 11539]EPQ58937.1 Phospholipase/carboxylesterase [Gloeophyllum trabeum ATCC 11539]
MASVLQPLKVLSVASCTRHTATVIFVHGLGDSGHGWKPVADILQGDPGLSHVKWVLPHAPTRRVTANRGMEMPAWYDIVAFGADSDPPEVEEGMLQSVRSLERLIANEVSEGIDPSRIVLGGFSQGGTMSLLTGLTIEMKLGSIVVLSGRLALKSKIKTMLSPHAKSVPIFWGHGTSDPVVKYQFATDSLDFMKSQLEIITIDRKLASPTSGGVVFNPYPGMGHSTSQQELDDLREWLKLVLPKDSA